MRWVTEPADGADVRWRPRSREGAPARAVERRGSRGSTPALTSAPAQAAVTAAASEDTEYAFTQAVLDSVDVGIVACDAAGGLTLFNGTAQRWHGVDVDARVAPSDWARTFDLFEPDGCTPLRLDEVPLAVALRSGSVSGRLMAIAPPGAVPRLVRCDGRQLRDAHGAVTGAVVAMTDVTSSLRVEADLTRQRDLARRVIETAADAYLSTDAEGHITEWNPAAEDLFGWPAVDALGMNLVELLAPPELAADYRSRLTTQIEGGDSVRSRCLELTARCRKGRELPVELTVWPMHTDAGWGLHAFARDISARSRQTRDLTSAHRNLTQALDAMPRSITLTEVERDATGHPTGLRVVWVNRHVTTVLGRPLEDIVGESFQDVFPKVAERFLQVYLDVAETGQTLNQPVEWFHGEFIRGAFEATVIPWSDDGLLIDVVDVTAARLAEAALRSSEARLREAQELAGLAGWEWDLLTGQVRWSPLMFQMLGVQPGVVPTPRLMVELVHPDDRDRFVAACQSATRVEATTALEFRVLRPGGGTVHIRAVATTERDPEGRAVRVWGTDQDVTATRTRERELTDAAHRDPLTGLLNRRGWAERTSRAVEAAPERQLTAVVMIDLDHFKQLNDVAGHAAGDTILRLCADRWQARLRSEDVLARIGGEEFALLLFGCDEDSARQLVDMLRAATPAPVTASAGIARLLHGETIEHALRRADSALYEAKLAGRNRSEVCATIPQQRPRPSVAGHDRRAQLT